MKNNALTVGQEYDSPVTIDVSNTRSYYRYYTERQAQGHLQLANPIQLIASSYPYILAY